jgi:UDP:flavonoid glycosyltransferase YjiC (YdhE family)
MRRQTVAVRVLLASTRGAGHFNPLVPFAEACLRGGHELLVAGPPALREPVEARGYPFWGFDDPPEGELDRVWSQVPSLTQDEQNVVVIRDIFARLDATASLPRLREACASWRPDVVLRDPNEYGSAIAAEQHGIPHARVGIGLAAMEELSLQVAAAALDDLRHAAGLPRDRKADVLRGAPYLTLFPASLEDPSEPQQPDTRRYSDPTWDAEPSEASGSWASGDDPLVYVTFGSVAGGMEMVAHVYGVAIQAVAELPVRVLLTVGHGADLSAFADAPANVHVEAWVPQADVLARAAAVVCHGGSGSTLGALAAGLPLVVVPLFADQPANTRRVEAIGAGLAIEPDPEAIRTAVRRVLEEEIFAARAREVAAELRAQPPVDDAVAFLADVAASSAA